MPMFPKKEADRLYQEGKMPEWWYRQHYKTAEENERDHFRDMAERSLQVLRQRAEEQQRKAQQQALEQEIDRAVQRAVEKALADPLK